MNNVTRMVLTVEGPGRPLDDPLPWLTDLWRANGCFATDAATAISSLRDKMLRGALTGQDAFGVEVQSLNAVLDSVRSTVASLHDDPDPYRVGFDAGTYTAGTDLQGKSIVIGTRALTDPDLTEGQRAAILTGIAAHEVGHIRFTRNFVPALEREFRGTPRERDAFGVSNIGDDNRVEDSMRREFPGVAGKSLEAMMWFTTRQQVKDLLAKGVEFPIRPSLRTAKDRKQVLTLAARWPWLGDWTDATEALAFGQSWAKRMAECVTAKQHVALVEEALEWIADVPEPEVQEPDPQPESPTQPDDQQQPEEAGEPNDKPGSDKSEPKQPKSKPSDKSDDEGDDDADSEESDEDGEDGESNDDTEGDDESEDSGEAEGEADDAEGDDEDGDGGEAEDDEADDSDESESGESNDDGEADDESDEPTEGGDKPGRSKSDSPERESDRSETDPDSKAGTDAEDSDSPMESESESGEPNDDEDDDDAEGDQDDESDAEGDDGDDESDSEESDETRETTSKTATSDLPQGEEERDLMPDLSDECAAKAAQERDQDAVAQAATAAHERARRDVKRMRRYPDAVNGMANGGVLVREAHISKEQRNSLRFRLAALGNEVTEGDLDAQAVSGRDAMVRDSYSHNSYKDRHVIRPSVESQARGAALAAVINSARKGHSAPERLARSGRIDRSRLARVGCGDYRVFTKRQAAAPQQVRVSILLDASSSMLGWVALPDGSSETKLNLTVQAARDLATALDSIAWAKATVYAHTYDNSGIFVAPLWKSGEKRELIDDYLRLRNGGTPDGYAIAYAADDLADALRPSEKGVIIVISDGEPSYLAGIDHTRSVVNFWRNRGFRIVSVSIDPALTPQDQRIMYGTDVVQYDPNVSVFARRLAQVIGSSL